MALHETLHWNEGSGHRLSCPYPEVRGNALTELRTGWPTGAVGRVESLGSEGFEV